MTMAFFTSQPIDIRYAEYAIIMRRCLVDSENFGVMQH